MWAFVFGSEAYHDYYRWPMKDKPTFEKWCRETHWGQLFTRYPDKPGAEMSPMLSAAPASSTT